MSRDYIHAFTPVEIAAQVWCEPEHSHTVMDAGLADTFAKFLANEQKHTNFWHECATAQQEVLGAAEAILAMVGAEKDPILPEEAIRRLKALFNTSGPRAGDPVWRARVPTYVAASASTAKQEELL